MTLLKLISFKWLLSMARKLLLNYLKEHRKILEAWVDHHVTIPRIKDEELNQVIKEVVDCIIDFLEEPI